MQYVNVPDALPENVYYATFFSRLYNHALGYCVYLPAAALQKACPAHYHFHGRLGQECSDVFAMEPVYQNGETIFVFPNVSYELEGQTNLPVERMVFEELIPEIERKYQAAGRRSISGFSMGGGMAVWFSLRHPGAFAEAIAYAGTFHHYYHPEYRTAFVPVERAEELYQGMMQAKWESERNLLALFNAAAKDTFQLTLRVGTQDPLYCDAEVLHRHLLSLDFPHTYARIEGAGHSLAEIV